ncbi:MAG: hypothetical protein Q4B46_07860, partial [Comamonadaceae bacterium]|nr:hypothetical protein [Comamonadaceae bacterium]
MKTLCITGFAHPALNTIAQHIFNSGLSTARASQQNESMDIEAWHQRVIAKHGDIAPVAKIGRLWEQLAADIFLNNLHTPAWGWTSPQSLALLDFWQQFDPQIYFVLVCVSPQQALTQAIADPSSDMAPAKVLEDWYTTHQTMLRFHLRHPERCMLIMAEDALSAPNQLIENLVSQWALPLQAAATSVHSPATDTSSAEVIAKHLAQQLLTDSSTENSLHQEILACITPLAQETLSASDTLSCEAVINAYRQLCDRSKEMHALEQAQAELSTTRSALQQQIHALHQAQDEQGKLSAKQAEQLKALEHTHAQLTTELADAKEESELLLTQLHQVQEELEGTFLKQQQTTQQLAAAKASLDALGQEKNQLIAARDTLNKQLTELTKARDEQAKIAAERKAQLDTLT